MSDPLSPQSIQQMLRADPSWKDIAMRHVFSDFSNATGTEELDSATLFDELIQLSPDDLKLKFRRDDWSCSVQNRYEDLSAIQAFDVVINMVHMLDSNSRHLLEKQAASIAASRRAAADEKMSERIRSEYLQSGCQRSDLESAISQLVTKCAELFEGPEQAQAFLMEQRVEVAQFGWNVWCRQADGRGTFWVRQVVAPTHDGAITQARSECASDWGWEGQEERILVVGVQRATADDPIVWDDDGLEPSTGDDLDDGSGEVMNAGDRP
jgi:hypothetical protein